MKSQFGILIYSALFLFYLCSCSNTKNSKHEPIGYELIEGDTFNLVDALGKQGVWIPSPTNKLKDTVYFRNDTLIQ